MSTTLRFATPASLPMAPLRRIVRRLDTVPTLYVGAAALAVLIGGLLLSIATTSDPSWWQLHFSQLGTFHDLSAAFFNNTLKTSGAIVVLFAFRVHSDVRRLGRGPVRRGAATVAFICLNVIGVNLALVGCVPLNTDKDLHDRVAGSMVLGFLALLLTAPVMFHRLGKRLAIGTGIALVWLIASIALFVTATINLALFETVACAAMFAWAGLFTQVLAGGLRAAVSSALDADTAEPGAPSPESGVGARPACAHTRPRRMRRPALLRGTGSAKRATTSGITRPHTRRAPAPTTPRASRRRRPASAKAGISASGAARVGSAGVRRLPAGSRALPLGLPAVLGAVHSRPR
ncbi:putative membrane protein [Microbacterium trichothecenolyticum]|uniref:Membrane protein n=1 Tax=Microbacterium trichothecenolyticum TaxID=69370 RepID=A0ABU0TVB6_MICTR|nr:putative membrane protein [Microbacterium trichothecenolyticum]